MNQTARVICAWKYTLRNADDFQNSTSLRYSGHILVIRTKSNREFGIHLDPSAIMILRERSQPLQEHTCASQVEREEKIN